MTVFNSAVRTAWKSHTCETCIRRIEPGEKYCRQTGNWDGEFYSRADCAGCHLAWQHYYRFEDQGWRDEGPGDLAEWLDQHGRLTTIMLAQGIWAAWNTAGAS